MILKKVSLTPRDSHLAGKYKSGETVIVECDATGAAFTVTMPDAVMVRDVVFVLVKTDSSANAVTIAFRNGQTASNAATLSLATQWTAKTIMPDGSNYVKTAEV